MTRAWNWRLWSGFVLVLLAPVGYFSLYEVVPAAFWTSIVLLIVGVILLIQGLRNAYGSPQSFRGKIAGPVLGTLALLIIGLFGFGKYEMSRAYAAAKNAPHVGDKAPEFAVIDGTGQRLTLAQLLSSPLPSTSTTKQTPRGILLVFYRGYW